VVPGLDVVVGSFHAVDHAFNCVSVSVSSGLLVWVMGREYPLLLMTKLEEDAC